MSDLFATECAALLVLSVSMGLVSKKKKKREDVWAIVTGGKWRHHVSATEHVFFATWQSQEAAGQSSYDTISW